MTWWGESKHGPSARAVRAHLFILTVSVRNTPRSFATQADRPDRRTDSRIWLGRMMWMAILGTHTFRGLTPLPPIVTRLCALGLAVLALHLGSRVVDAAIVRRARCGSGMRSLA
jgi:hypothetical protein